MENTSKGAIIEQLIQHGVLSRSEMVRLTGLSRSVITLSTIELMRDGIIRKDGTGISTGGRRPDTFRLSGDGRLVLGVALEDDLSILSLYTLDGQCLERTAEPLAPDSDYQRVVRQVARQAASRLAAHPDRTALGCGIALPSIADAETDLVTSNGFRWEAIPARALFEAALGLPCTLLDNAHAAALGELWLGGRALRRNLVYLYMGRGAGGAVIVDRRLYLGRNHAAGEFGAMLIGGETIDGPFYGKLDVLTDQAVTIQWMNALRDRAPASSLPPDIAPEAFLPAVAAADAGGDALAAAVVRRLVACAAAACANLVNALNPDEVIIGGPIAVLGAPFIRAVHERARDLTLPVPFASARILPAKPREETIPLGAAATIIQRSPELLSRLAHA